MLPKVRAIFLSTLLLFTPPLLADTKPFAPDKILGATTVNAQQVAELILANPDMVVIDSRKRIEYAKGHIEGAVNILNSEMQRTVLSRIAPDLNQPVLFYCNGTRCLRSSDAASKAHRWGYKNVYWFRGGWNEWMENRLPVITD